MQVKRYLALMP